MYVCTSHAATLNTVYSGCAAVPVPRGRLKKQHEAIPSVDIHI